MPEQRIPISRETWRRLLRAITEFTSSEQGWKAKLAFALLLAFLFGINALNVVNSYVARHFMTAIADRNWSSFVNQSILYVLVFASSTVTAAFYRFTEERLALMWRRWLTGLMISRYLEQRTYYRLQLNDDLPNPDQRIAEDTRAFTATTLSFSLMFLNATFTVIAFAGVLWSISAPLFAVAVLYAALGTLFTIWLGRPLVWLNYGQSDHEANLRFELIRVRENAGRIALAQREDQVRARLLQRLDALTANWRNIIGINRNLYMFSNGYNYMIQIIPALIIAPAFIRGEVEFGVITQSAMAFAQLLGAFSLIVTQFQQISTFTAVVARLGSLAEAVARVRRDDNAGIAATVGEDRVAYENVTLRSPDRSAVLIADLSAEFAPGTNVLVRGTSEVSVNALFDATAGLWPAGEGQIRLPKAGKVVFLPERPYLPPGRLSDVLVPSELRVSVSDADLLRALEFVGVETLPARVGGFDIERNWDEVLPLAEQQLLVIARALLFEPQFIIFQQLTATLDVERTHPLLRALEERGITYINFGSADACLKCYDAVLELGGDGGWQFRPDTREYNLL